MTPLEAARLKSAIEGQRERVYLSCLDMALKHCDGWKIDGKKIDNAEGFCILAKIFADNSISQLEKTT